MSDRAAPFSPAGMAVIRWAAQECERQRSGELSVSDMLAAWQFARGESAHHDKVSEAHVLELARLIEPVKNANGYRRVGVRVGSDVKGPWQDVPRQMADLVEGRLNPKEWWDAFERIHPFVDGNGRVGSLILNWHNRTLGAPIHSPDWDDPHGYWEPPFDLRANLRRAEEQWAVYRTMKGTTI